MQRTDENGDPSPTLNQGGEANRTRSSPAPPALPPAPIERWIQPFTRFFRIEAAGGFVLLGCAIVAVLLANSPFAHVFADIWRTEVTLLRIGTQFELTHSIAHWITEGLMTIFFFVMGLEIKRELVAGELRDPKKAALPVLAALGGMILPVGVFLLVLGGAPGAGGMAIPVATDIAFVVALIAILGTRVPPGLKIFILSLAIADDIGAVVVIALFYTAEISFTALGFAAMGFGIIFLLNRVGVRRVPVYVFFGAIIWLAFLHSGVHPTVAGVLLGLLTPASAWIGDDTFLAVASNALRRIRSSFESSHEPESMPPAPSVASPRQPHTTLSSRERQRAVGTLATTAYESVSPLERLEFALHPWVAFAIVPLFALANVGVTIDLDALGQPVLIAVAAGLVLGKPLGIVMFSYFAVKANLARLPAGVNWKVMVGAGCLAGIGFTMSLLIASLSLSDSLLEAGKIGTLVGSLISAVFGMALLLAFLPRGAVEGEQSDSGPAGLEAGAEAALQDEGRPFGVA